MAKKPAGASQDDSLSMGEVNLDDLSLDDEALFADLDNEVRLSDPEGLGDELGADDKAGEVNLDFSVTDETATPELSAPKGKSAKNGKNGKNGKAAKPGKAAAKGDSAELDLEDLNLGEATETRGTDQSMDLDLNLDDLNLDDLGSTPGGAKDGDDLLDLATSEGEGSGEEGLQLDLGEEGAEEAGAAVAMDSDLEEGLALPDDLDLNLEEHQAGAKAKPAAPGTADELDLDLDALSLAEEHEKEAAGAEESLELEPLEGLEAAEHQPAAPKAGAVEGTMGMLDMEELPPAGEG
ncbi:MAG TPA: hypothetical protein VL359_12465, partial [bacterium]|nr:hypothetical protein [bacterium]